MDAMSPRLQEAHALVGACARAILIHAIDRGVEWLASKECADQQALLKQYIRERDDIILDESTLTPECIGQLMGGN